MLADGAAGGTGLGAATDAELARRVAAGRGDPAAEAELCRRFGDRIRLYGLRHLRDEERARDLVQSVLLAVLQALRGGRLDEPERLDRFVLGTCRHLALRARAADGRAAPTPTEALDALAGASWPPEHGALDVGALLRCMALLDARARTVLHLSFQRDKSADEIAAVLALTPGNVRVVRHRAVGQLRRCLDAPRGEAR